MGYLATGSGDFLEYRAEKDSEIVDVVRDSEYDFYSCSKRTDFGLIATDGALAIAHDQPHRLALYEVQKPKGITELKLGEIRGTVRGARATRAWAVLTRDRKIEVTFPDLRQPANPSAPRSHFSKSET